MRRYVLLCEKETSAVSQILAGRSKVVNRTQRFQDGF